MAKELLTKKKLAFIEITYNKASKNYDTKFAELVKKTKHKTFPQIFEGAKFIGGYTELAAKLK